MNVTTIPTWKPIKVRHIVSLAGMALVLSGIVAFSGALNDGTATRVEPKSAMPAVSASVAPLEAPFVVYLVGSPEQAAELVRQNANQSFALNLMGWVPTADLGTILVRGPMAEVAVDSMNEAFGARGHTVRFIDMGGR